MQGDEDSAFLMRVDDDSLLRDAHRLILDNEHSTAEMLDLLSSAAASPDAQMTFPPAPARHVTISEDVTVFADSATDLLDLPPALALLYYVAVADASAPHLQHVLEVIGSPAPAVPRANALYAEGLRRKEENAAWREAQLRAQIEAEARACTFKPKISSSAQEIAPKGLETFMEKCIEWKKSAEMRLAKKAAQDRVNRGEDEWMTPWKMGERTRQIVEKARASGKVREKLWKPKVHCRAGEADGHETFALDAPSFRPVLRAVHARSVSDLLHAAEDSARDDFSGGAPYLSRVEADKQRRAENLERLRAHYASLEAQRFFDPETGQPLFSPNAPPTVLRGDTRISFDALSPDERRTAVAHMRRAQKEFVLARIRRAALAPEKRRAADELLTHLCDRSARARQMARLLAEDNAAAPFRPEMCARSERMMRRAQRTPVHARPLPRPATARNIPHNDNDNHNNHNDSNNNEKEKEKDKDKAFREMLLRAAEWDAARRRRLERARDAAERRQMAPCTFRPQRETRAETNRAETNADALAASAAARMRSEVEVLRLQAALHDESFMRSADSVSRAALSLASAPRPSRQSVERHAETALSPRGLWANVRCNVSQRARGAFGRKAACHDEDEGSEAEEEPYGFIDENEEEDEEDFLEEFGESDAQDDASALPLADSWAELDAQTDSILKNCQFY